MNNVIVLSVVRSIFAFALLIVVLRFMGRKSISQATFFNLATIITIGAIAANIAIGSKPTFTSTTTALITFGILCIIMSYGYIESSFRKLVNSEPVIAIKNGTIMEKNLKKVRLTIDDLMKLLRERSVFNAADVEFAVLENDGELSVLPKSQKQPLTPSDLSIPTSYTGLTKDLVIDGVVMSENLNGTGLDKDWLSRQLNLQGIRSAEEVFYAGLDTSGKLYVSMKEKGREKHGLHGIE